MFSETLQMKPAHTEDPFSSGSQAPPICIGKGDGVLELLERSCQRFKDQPAIEWGEKQVSYSALDEMANRVANCLAASQLSNGSLIATLLENRIEIIATLIGILRAGCVFVPLAPEWPEDLLSKILSDLSPDCFIIEGSFNQLIPKISGGDKKPQLIINLSTNSLPNNLAEGPIPSGALPANFSASKPLVSIDTERMCYIYYTSGSAGSPKGIAGRLKSISHFIRWEIQTFNIPPGWRFSQFTQPAFDAFLRDVFVPLCSGGTVCIPPDNPARMGLTLLLDWIDSKKINLIHCVPSLFGAMVGGNLAPDKFKSLEYILMAGESLPVSDVKKWREVFGSRIKLVNLYGATETTMVKFYHPIDDSDMERGFIPIGKPMKGARAVVLDPHGNLCPQGVFGELYIRTPYQSLGYYNNPELTRQVFVKNPFSEDPNDLIYKTGDLARVLRDGNFQLGGRKDNQVKIRGIRLELDEIENQLRNHPRVKNAVVAAREDAAGSKRLAAYLVADLAADRVPLQSTCLVEWGGNCPVELTAADLSSSGVGLLNVPPTWFAGMEVRCRLQLRPASEGVCLEATVAWRSGDRAGIVFQTAPHLRELLGQSLKQIGETQTVGLRRAGLRVPLHSSCLVEFSDGTRVELATENISLGGIRLVTGASTAAPAERLRLRLQLPGFEDAVWLWGTVKWHQEERAGIQFETTPAQREQIGQALQWAISARGLSISDLRSFLKKKLPDYMVPSAFVILDALPLLPNGKVDRRALPFPETERPELEATAGAPQDTLELQLAQIWQEVLGIKPVGVKDNFFELGGHSLLAVRLFSKIGEVFGKELPLPAIFQAPTVEELAAVLRQQGFSAPEESLVLLNAGGSKPPLFCIYGILLYYDLARHLDADRPVYGVYLPDEVDLLTADLPEKQLAVLSSVPQLASRYLKQIRTLQPEGPYFLAGESFGGLVAFEMAQQLRAQGETVNLLALFDSLVPGDRKQLPLAERLSLHFQNLSRGGLAYALNKAWRRLSLSLDKLLGITGRIYGMFDSGRRRDKFSYLQEAAQRDVRKMVRSQAVTNYLPQPYPDKMVLFRAMERNEFDPYCADPQLGWGLFAAGGLEVHDVPGDHLGILKAPNVQVMAAKLRACLERAEMAATFRG